MCLDLSAKRARCVVAPQIEAMRRAHSASTNDCNAFLPARGAQRFFWAPPKGPHHSGWNSLGSIVSLQAIGRGRHASISKKAVRVCVWVVCRRKGGVVGEGQKNKSCSRGSSQER